MAQSLSQLYVHIVFHVKNNKLLIRQEDSSKIYEYIGGILNQNGCTPIQINGTGDHVHILCRFTRNTVIAKLVQDVKATSSRWIKEISPYYHYFSWQGGYGAFSVSKSQSEKTANYIINQETHHRKQSSKEEYIALLKAHNITFDEKYLWND